MVFLTSAESLLALLDESDQTLQVYALEQLNLLVDEFWAEITNQVSRMYSIRLSPCCIVLDADVFVFREELYENERFPQRKLAALVVSKVCVIFFNLHSSSALSDSCLSHRSITILENSLPRWNLP